MSKKAKSNKKTRSRKNIPGTKFVTKQKHITEYLLTKNGLRILLVDVKNSPTLSTSIVYGVGSRNESEGETGLSHMLEHMLFKPNVDGKLLWKVLEEQGAIVNANTWLDRTHYYFNCTKELLEDALIAEADRMRRISFSEKEFLPERTNVLSEFEMYNTRHDIALEWNVMNTAFHRSRYRHDTIGYRIDIENYNKEQLKQFYDRYYWPNNATLTIAGTFDHDTTLRLITKLFGHIAKGPEFNGETVGIHEPPQEGVRRIVLERDTNARTCMLAFKAPSFRDLEWLHLYAVLTYLEGTKVSPLHTKLIDAGYASSVHASMYPTRDPFLAFITVAASEKTPYEKTESIVFEEIQRIISNGISASALMQIKSRLRASELLKRDGSYNIVSALAEYTATGDWMRYVHTLDAINSITPADLQHAAEKYLTLRTATVGTLENPTSI